VYSGGINNSYCSVRSWPNFPSYGAWLPADALCRKYSAAVTGAGDEVASGGPLPRHDNERLHNILARPSAVLEPLGSAYPRLDTQ
jgi:hypothetical protein